MLAKRVKLHIPTIDVQPHQAAHLRIACCLREQILAGKIAPGTRLPSTQELARSWRTHVPTVHKALVILTKEGLLERLRKRGTFVRAENQRLSTIGIYFDRNIWSIDDKTAKFPRYIYGCFAKMLAAKAIEERFFFDDGGHAGKGRILPGLESAIATHGIQALFVLIVDQANSGWLSHPRIPVVGMSRAIPANVSFDLRDFIDVGVRGLVAQGCRSIGLISAMARRHSWFSRHFRAVIRNTGARTRNEWILQPEEDLPAGHELFGYEQFLKLWHGSRRPDGLLVYTDNAAEGVITAILRERVDVPEDLHLAFHRNQGIDYLCPLPATFVEGDCRVLVDALWRQLQCQLGGEKPDPVRVGFSLRESRASDYGGNRPARSRCGQQIKV